MKKIAKKLIFSSLALGASVLTLTTTTYAWYVQNNTAQATNITASTADNDSDSLFISKNGTSGWGNKLDLNNTSIGVLVPASLKTGFSGFAAEQFCLPTDANNATTPSAAPDGKAKVASESFYLISTNKEMTVVPTLTVVNTTETAAFPEQTAYSTEGTTGLNSEDFAAGNAKFKVDAVRALRMAVVLTDYKTDTPTVTTNIYDVMSIAKKPRVALTDSFTGYTQVDGTVNFGDVTGTIADKTAGLKGANAYYMDIVGTAPNFGFVEQSANAPKTSWGDIVLTQGKKVKVDVYFWLEGTDSDCFDSCAGQSFKFGFDFTKKVTA